MITIEPSKTSGETRFDLPKLPYATDGLSPHISAEALDLHYNQHHRGYVDTLNQLVADSELGDHPLEKVIEISAQHDELTDVYNNAAQVWNHTLFWHSMKPIGGGQPPENVALALAKSFGSLAAFRDRFKETALSRFGSGWVWLISDKNGLSVESTGNADTPLTDGRTAVLTCDVWEHAYYPDYQNRREAFVDAFLNDLINWDFLGENLEAVS